VCLCECAYECAHMWVEYEDKTLRNKARDVSATLLYVKVNYISVRSISIFSWLSSYNKQYDKV